MHPTVGVTLLDVPKRRPDIIEFRHNGIAHAAEPGHEADNADRRDEDQFRRENETSFVPQKLPYVCRHEFLRAGGAEDCCTASVE